MKVINKKAHIDKDGILKLDIATQLSESDVEIVVVINPVNRDYQIEELSELEILIIEERWEEYQKNPKKTKTWEQVKASITNKYGV
ncbi:MAG: hypothetical protein V4511_08815 [Bacteroidota bacterium]